MAFNYRLVLFCIDAYFRMQMFIWNNIFFSLGFDVRDHYKDFGGDAAAYAAPVSVSYFSFPGEWINVKNIPIVFSL